ncbi:MAG: aminodeoxychorismate/anthranilate synthase component II [Candidatus Omnitrophota bacterium]|nr:MAG: aminodeoxychorismate/anthranilate synthase component II [Candidatus Omnitrophota bacterium]HDN86277.1 aminodeoxychorismate/anthranilate synthase component II [Candidatus Omnitrophota bacterium]
MVLVIDNYDSFTYNLVQYLEELGEEVLVYRNDKITLEKIKKLKPDRIVISPGPGTPLSAGISCELIKSFYQHFPILGVCLGHQCIGYVFGAKIVRAPKIMHGKVSLIYHDGKKLFKGVKNPFLATRYHSLIINRKTLPSNLVVNASTEDGIIMGVRDRRFPLWGVQFHPESILTEEGKKILKNFLSL